MKNSRFRIVSFVLALVMLLSSCNIVAFAATKKTSSKLRYPQEYMNTEMNYPTISKLNASGMFAVPGLEYTNVNGKGCDTMVPQGLCVAGDYILISAYDGIELYKSNLEERIKTDINKMLYSKESKHNIHNSVIYVLSKKDKSYLTTLVLPDFNHVGGLAYDGDYIWVAKGSDCALSAIKYSTVSNAVKSKKDSVSVKYYQTAPCGIRASMVTYYNNRLWVGVFNKDSNGYLKGFDVYRNSKKKLYLLPYRTITLPNKANGVVLASVGGKTQMVVNTSYGRNSASNAYFYTLNINKDYSLSDYTLRKKLKLPPMAEEICIDGSRVYNLFESGATPYSSVCGNRAKNIVDRVCVSNIKSYFPWTSSSSVDKAKAAPNSIKELKLKSNTTNSITISWDRVSGADGYYVYRYITSSDSFSRQATLSSSATKYTQNGLSYATDYDYLVVPYNSSGAARSGSMLYAMTLPIGTKITSISTSKKDHSISVEWDKVARIDGYEIQYSKDKNFKDSVITSIVESENVTYNKATKLTKNTDYFVRARVFKSYAGKTYYSSWSSKQVITVK